MFKHNQKEANGRQALLPHRAPKGKSVLGTAGKVATSLTPGSSRHKPDSHFATFSVTRSFSQDSHPIWF